MWSPVNGVASISLTKLEPPDPDGNLKRGSESAKGIGGLSVLSFRCRLLSLICLCVVLAVAHSIY